MSEGSPLDTLGQHHRCPTKTRSRKKSRSPLATFFKL